MNKQKGLFTLPVLQPRKKQRRMGRSFCPLCCETINTFVVDQDFGFIIRLCLKCAKEELFEVNLSKAVKCQECGKLFMKRKSTTCPVCWIEYFKEKEGIK